MPGQAVAHAQCFAEGLLAATTLGLLAVGLFPGVAEASSATSLATRVTATANVRSSPSVASSSNIVGRISAGSVVVAHCQTVSWDGYPVTVAGYGTSWLFDWVTYRVPEGWYASGYISDLFSSATPYQIRDSRLADCHNLGDIDIEAYCQSVSGKWHAVLLNRNDPYSWGCGPGVWFQRSLDYWNMSLTNACNQQYRDPGESDYITYYRAVLTQAGNPYSWRCAVEYA
jgi:hypothetical protein